MSDTKTSRFIALILRHRPEAIGISLDEHGWADVNELINGIAKTRPFTFKDLERIVSQDSKQRYSFNQDRSKIRASQGHSIDVDVELKQMDPPDILYHGTGIKYVDFIDVQGLKPMNRLYVHLSKDIETAEKVGSRHGRPCIYSIDCKSMVNDGYLFYLSENGVWLTKEVPISYLHKI